MALNCGALPESLLESELFGHEKGAFTALERAGQNQTRAVQVLKISREQLRTRMKRYGLLRSKS